MSLRRGGLDGLTLDSMGYFSGGSGAAPTTTWNPADKSAGLTLSGGNLVGTSSSNYDGARSVASASSGKKYWEVVSTVNLDNYPGVANGSAAFSVFGFNANSLSWTVGGQVWINSSTVATAQSWTSGDVLGFALDIGNARLWVRKGAGNWNNDAGADPTTNTNGIDVSSLSTPLYAAASAGTNGVITSNFGGSAYANAAPSGFGNW